MRGGAYLVEEFLAHGDGEFSYRAYDVPSRCPVILHEFFPTGARRDALQVSAPTGWSTQGFEMAKAKWLQCQKEALAIFEENGTAYLVFNTDSLNADLPRTFSPSQLQPEYFAPATSPPISVSISAPDSTQNSAPIRRFSFADLWPDAWRGALQGGTLCGVAGVLLGALAAVFGQNNLLSGALMGAWAFPVGAVCGGLLGVLRALPSNATQLASASPVTAQDQRRSTLEGAGKGALMGFVLGVLLIAAAIFNGYEILFSAVPQGLLLFTLSGAIGGAVVGFIRINPRDRSRGK